MNYLAVRTDVAGGMMTKSDARAFRKLLQWQDRHREEFQWLATTNVEDPASGPYFALPNVTGFPAGVALKPEYGQWLMIYGASHSKSQTAVIGSQTDPESAIAAALSKALAGVAFEIRETDPDTAREFLSGVLTLARGTRDSTLEAWARNCLIGIDRINAVQRALTDFVPTLENDLLFDDGLNCLTLRIAVTDDSTEQYFFQKGYLWSQFNFVTTGPFTMPPSTRRSPYSERDDVVSMAIWIVANVGNYAVLQAYSTEPFTEISDAERAKLRVRLGALVDFLAEVRGGTIPSSAANRDLARDLLHQYIYLPLQAWQAKNNP